MHPGTSKLEPALITRKQVSNVKGCCLYQAYASACRYEYGHILEKTKLSIMPLCGEFENFQCFTHTHAHTSPIHVCVCVQVHVSFRERRK